MWEVDLIIHPVNLLCLLSLAYTDLHATLTSGLFRTHFFPHPIDHNRNQERCNAVCDDSHTCGRCHSGQRFVSCQEKKGLFNQKKLV